MLSLPTPLAKTFPRTTREKTHEDAEITTPLSAGLRPTPQNVRKTGLGGGRRGRGNVYPAQSQEIDQDVRLGQVSQDPHLRRRPDLDQGRREQHVVLLRPLRLVGEVADQKVDLAVGHA